MRYQHYILQRCDAILFSRMLSTFARNLLPPSWGQKSEIDSEDGSEGSFETAVPMYGRTGRNVVSAGVTSISRQSLSDVTAVNKRNSTNGNLRHINKAVAVLLNELCSFGKFI
jgi:hypothetical protein